MKTTYLGIPVLLTCICSYSLAIAGQPQKPASVPKVKVDNRPLSEDQKILHVLNRLGFGARPGDVEKVRKTGLKNYIEQQLNPEKISDEALDKKTASFETLKLSGLEIAEMERAVLMSNQRIQRLQSEMAQRGAMEASGAIQGAITNAQTGTPPNPAQQVRGARQLYQNATPEERKQLEEGRMAREKVNRSGSDLVMNKIIRAAESEKQLFEVMVDFWSNHFNIDATKVRASKIVDEQQVIRPNALGKFRDLLNASATSAAMMLYLDNAQSVAAQETALRPIQRNPANFTFEQVKQAAERGVPVARQMMDRLTDRAKTEGVTEEELYKRMQQIQQRPAQAQKRGLNENYARELLELHTLGVDGGYTQKDVTEVARCLTGWGTRGGRYSGEFEYHAAQHDRGEKVVLGKTIPAGGGIEDGKQVLDILVSHPSTMRFISSKICRRLVADDPPKKLVDRCVETWKKTDGDIREIVRTIATSPEFFSRSVYKSKIKSPFEYVVSSVRATGSTVVLPPADNAPGAGLRMLGAGINVFAPNGSGQINTKLLAGQIGTLGQPLFNYGFPTGYPEDSSKWVSSGALIGRINFALGLLDGRINDVELNRSLLEPKEMEGKPVSVQIDTMAKVVLGGEITASTRATLLKQLQSSVLEETSTPDARRIASLLLGSPDFQRR